MERKIPEDPNYYALDRRLVEMLARFKRLSAADDFDMDQIPATELVIPPPTEGGRSVAGQTATALRKRSPRKSQDGRRKRQRTCQTCNRCGHPRSGSNHGRTYSKTHPLYCTSKITGLPQTWTIYLEPITNPFLPIQKVYIMQRGVVFIKSMYVRNK